MFAQIDGGKMDYFVALALRGPHVFFDTSRKLSPGQMMLAQSTPSAAVLGYYRRDDLPDYFRLADEYVLFDNFFQAMSGGSTGNALYLIAARSAVSSKVPPDKVGSLTPPVFDRPYDSGGILINDLPPINGPTETFMGSIDLSPPPEEQTYPTIADRLDAASLSWAWYNEGWNAVKPWALKTAFDAGDCSVVVDTAEAYLPHHNPFQYLPSWSQNVKAGRMRDSTDFFEDLRTEKLPQVSFFSKRPAAATSTRPTLRRAGASNGSWGCCRQLAKAAPGRRPRSSSPTTKAAVSGITSRRRGPTRMAAAPASRHC
jgi:phospholipase C